LTGLGIFDLTKEDASEIDLMNTGMFYARGGKGTMKDIERERDFRLKKIKKERAPVDYEKLKLRNELYGKEIGKHKVKRKAEIKKTTDLLDLTAKHS
jgi:hypothetical protein